MHGARCRHTLLASTRAPCIIVAMRTLAALLLASVLTFTALTVHGAEPWLKPNDVVALVGGEDMVALAEEGWLETLVTWAQPKDRIRWRSLAWEGDTVFEQRRDLNYPTLEAQLDRMGATVVLCQFGKMESFAGKEGVAAFTEAYEKLLARLSGKKKRRIVVEGALNPTGNDWDGVYITLIDREWKLSDGTPLWSWTRLGETIKLVGDGRIGEKKRRIALVLPMQFATRPKGTASQHLPDLTPRNADLASYRTAIRTLAGKHAGLLLDADYLGSTSTVPHYRTRDGIHLRDSDNYPLYDSLGQFSLAAMLAEGLGDKLDIEKEKPTGSFLSRPDLRDTIVAKNRLWFHYTRPQNWAFLAGNRTNQPSSRDHLDPTKRWFPEEMEQWLPLIEAKEKEIWALADVPR
jgi:hypothetical protein